MSIAIGLRAQRGGAVCVTVAVEADGPRVVASAVLAMGSEGDRWAVEPYTLARERVMAGDALSEVAACVAEGRRRQDVAAVEGLRAVAGLETPVVGLLVNRAGWIEDLLGYSVEWAEHAAVAEGLAVREALRAGCSALHFHVSEFDEKMLFERAVIALGLDLVEIEGRLKATGAGVKPWRKEQKLAALAAWLAAAVQGK